MVDPENGTIREATEMAKKRGNVGNKCKQHTAAYKAQVALAAFNADRTVNELASPASTQG